MKRLFSYCLLTVALMLGVAGVSANVWEKDLIDRGESIANTDHEAPEPMQSDYLIKVLDQPFIPTGVTRATHSRVPSTVAKEEMNLYDSHISCFSQLTLQQLYTTKSIYVSLYAEKQKSGYYIYSLRKLLI